MLLNSMNLRHHLRHEVGLCVPRRLSMYGAMMFQGADSEVGFRD